MPHVQLAGLKKAYGSHVALQDISLDIERGHFFTLLGPSGCGKTTLLRAIAGFHRQDQGDILLEGQSISHLNANERDVGMVFQDYAVFPHLSVFDNVAFGLVQKKLSRSEIQQRVSDILATVQLESYAQRMPHQLSGGQQQRVGLARALVIRPKVLLMDEPLSNLDAKLRVDLRRDIRALQQRLGITTLYVTHDQEEALSLSDQICVMHNGVVQQVGSPWDIYQAPANRFVATFVGSNNFFDIDRRADGQWYVLGQAIDGHLPDNRLMRPGIGASVRPEKIKVNASLQGPGIQIAGRIRQSMFSGRELQLTVEVEGYGAVDALVSPSVDNVNLHLNDAVQLSIASADLQYFEPGETGARIP